MSPRDTKTKKMLLALWREETPCKQGTGNVGGHLHDVTDDGNWDIQSCVEDAVTADCVPCTMLGCRLMLLNDGAQMKNIIDAAEKELRAELRAENMEQDGIG